MDASYSAPRRSRAKLHPDIFLPPQTPASAKRSRYAPANPSTLIASSKNKNGKRERPSSGGRQSPYNTPLLATGAEWSASSSMVRSDVASPLTLVNTSYNSKGGLDTPSQELEAVYERTSDGMETDFRRRWGATTGNAPELGSRPDTTVLNERNGRSRIASTAQYSPPTSGWGSSMLNFVGGVAGKMWTFCNTTVFGGFQAGGGQKYAWQGKEAGRTANMHTSDAWEDMNSSRLRPSPSADITFRSPSPMPGMWPDQASPDFTSGFDSPSSRPAKRIHTDTGQGWIMVEKVESYNHYPSEAMSNTRKISSPYSIGIPRPSSRMQSRRSATSVSRRSVSHVGCGTPVNIRVHQRQKSSISTNHFETSVALDDSPISAEAQRYADRVRKEEKQTDASIRRLNDRLAAMIKEGKEALGTKIEVIEGADCEDEGFGEGVFG